MQDLINTINDFILERQSQNDIEHSSKAEERRETGNFKFFPSSIGKCSRMVVYEMLGYQKKELPPKVLRILDNGNSMHLRYQDMFAEMGILIAPELPIKEPELGISGRTDALIKIEDELILVELKSANQKACDKMRKNNLPKEEYVMQLQLYLHLTGIQKGIILVENKNDQELLEYAVNYDPEIAKKLISKIEHCIKHAKQGKLPPREYEMVGWDSPCKFCDFNEECWKQEWK